MLAQAVAPDSDPCELADRWRISTPVATALVLAVSQFVRDPRVRAILGGARPVVSIISGHRTPIEQAELCSRLPEGRPCADPDASTHTSCPATGVDLRMDGATPELWQLLGSFWERLGGRWGGRFGDSNHFDLGAR